MEERHAARRIRREARRRTVTVADRIWLSPHMLRVQFSSPDLIGFESAAPDDHVRLFVPVPGGEIAARDYTPRSFDPRAGRLAIDFFIHEAGPATQWACAVAKGDRIEIGGPRSSLIVADDFDWYLLVGDETGFPAIGRRLEELRADVPVIVILADAECAAPPMEQRKGLSVLRCGGPDLVGEVASAIDDHWPMAGEGYVWIAGEAGFARSLRSHVVDVRGHPRAWTRAAGYWSRGASGRHEKIDD